MDSSTSSLDSSVEPRPSRRRRRQFSLQTLLSAMSGVSIVLTAFTLPGIGGLLLAIFGWPLPALVIISSLVCLQWPLMIVAMRMSRGHRHRLREERRAFILPKPRG